MKSVVCFGEALIDFLNIGQQQAPPLMLNEFRQYPGGAPANVAVAVAKLGGEALFAGQVGQDAFGDFLQQSLNQYQVNTQYLLRHPSAKTALAFVMLDEIGDRSFSFYRDDSADMLFEPAQVESAWFDTAACLHFCSNTLTSALSTQTTQKALSMASDRGLLISFDVNLRHNLWPDNCVDIARINHFVAQADMVKFSADELAFLAQGQTDEYIKQQLSQGVTAIVVTDGANDIHYYSGNISGMIKAPKVTAIDTTAAGDAFTGALLFGLSQFEQPQQVLLDAEKFAKIVEFASFCGAHAVTKQGAFPALPQFEDVSQYWLYNG